MASDSGGRSGNYYQILDDPPSKRIYNINNTHDFPIPQKPKKQKAIVKQPKFIIMKPLVDNIPINSVLSIHSDGINFVRTTGKNKFQQKW